MENGVGLKEIESYSRVFGFTDKDNDGKHSKVEYVDNGNYLNKQSRAGIFNASDNDRDGFVSRAEYVLNRIITDEAKAIVQAMDAMLAPIRKYEEHGVRMVLPGRDRVLREVTVIPWMIMASYDQPEAAMVLGKLDGYQNTKCAGYKLQEWQQKQ